ncbi:hypothetical protein [Microbispora sp. ATCC PTA-5024]|uniref:hypothetical protein n=1 Tax=Microbispora sp. ATCC PTA-5024 TaxID=316330 RepID=UPI0003DD2EBC|nr:hypothetical protein [Microbispora sp. ATCC PTA-5024]ETK38062.1 hypothetical protein MPTA5024_00685 [Microbispora sp. ATCC PTA-5024]
MGIARNASAISAGALAIALGGGLPLAFAAPAHALDCTNGGGLVSGVTSGLCSVVDGVGGVVDGVTDAADKATGGATQPVTKAVDDAVSTTTGAAGSAVDDVGHAVDDTVNTTVDDVGKAATGAVGAVGQTVDGAVQHTGTAVNDGAGSVGGAVDHTVETVKGVTGAGTPSAGPTARLTDGLTKTIRDSCLPLVGGGCAPGAEGGKPGSVAPERPRPSAGVLPREPYHPLRPSYVPAGGVSADGDVARVHPDRDGLIPLLWPGQRIPDLIGDLRGGPVRPHKSYDGVGTALTAALLLSAVLATRVVSARRARAEQQESIPFEGGLRMPGRSGRHRLA